MPADLGRLRRTVSIVVLLGAMVACTRAPVPFSEQNARAHIGMLAGTVGSRAVGTPSNARARAYIVDQLRLSGFDVRVQETDARRPEIGRTARVANIIATRPGDRDEAVGILCHYDSAPEAPGAADDGLGVGVALEAARVLGARDKRPWTVMVLVTDGEEAGLMGAAGLMSDRDVARRLHAYFNIDAAGSSDPALLFEAGPGNGWLVTPWARHAPHPRGASFGVEIYKRLPNDTDFSILKRHEIPGLNFATVGDSYTYHTARDTPDRIPGRTIRELGGNVVATSAALDGVDITARSTAEPTYFDVGGTTAYTYGSPVASLLAIGALMFGVLAWVKMTAAAIRMAGVIRWLLTILWIVVGAAIAAAAMVVATWAMRAAREVYHPWYAHPDRLFLLLLTTGIAVGWTVGRLGQWLPPRAHGLRNPVVTWSAALPVWIALAMAALWLFPGAAYLWVLPLLAAGVLLSIVPAGSAAGVRAASIVVLAVSTTLWMRDTIDLLRFVVAVFGRLPIVTPLFVFAAIIAAAGIMIVPPLLAVAATTRPLLRPSIVTAVCLLAIATTGALAYTAPAYTYDQPLRRHVRALQDTPDAPALWEVASTEPGLDLGPGAPSGWVPSAVAAAASIPWGRFPHPFVFRTQGPALGRPPADLAAFAVNPVAAGVELSVSVVPREPGLVVSFVLPAGVTPARHNLPGTLRGGRWSATYVAPPPEGVLFRASFAAGAGPMLRDTRVAVTTFRLPGGQGWQSLPAWLPQEHVVWSASATWSLTPASAPIAPVSPLR